MAWILGSFDRKPDDNFSHKASDGTTLEKFWRPNLGRVVIMGPLEAHSMMDLTAPPGTTSGVYYGLCFQLRKWDFQVQKFDESIEVSPVHGQYYQMTMKQKEDLEARIKSGLASAAQSISDYELIKHDERKYQEFLDYYQTNDEHSLRAVFIDQVDSHTGESVAMRSIAQRWPTLISDFLKLTPADTDPDKVKERLKLSKAEAVVLVTKNKLYNEWKELFVKEVSNRMERIRQLVRSREQSITQYREWLKPYVARFKMIREGYASPETRKSDYTSFIAAGGHATSSSSVTIWAWKDMQPIELTRAAPELMAEKKIDPYDQWTKENLIFHPGHGLIVDYPWIAGVDSDGKIWADSAAETIKREWMAAHRLYYGFLEVRYVRSNLRLASGAELEDGMFFITCTLLSQNALLAKLMELKAKQEDLERYINSLLGVEPLPKKVLSPAEEKIIVKELEGRMDKENAKLADLHKKAKDTKDKTEKARIELSINKQEGVIKKLKVEIGAKKKIIVIQEASVNRKFKMPWGILFFRNPGPYERIMEERLTNYYAGNVAGTMYFAMTALLKEKFGFGKP